MIQRWLDYMMHSLLILATLAWASLATAADYTVGVVPQFPALAIHRTWTPLLERLSTMTGHMFKLEQYATIPDFEKAFLGGKPDLVYLNPYHMVMANGAQRYLPLVRDGQNKLSGILVVRADSTAKTLADLDGKTIAFPSPNAFGASLYLRALLAQSGATIKPDYVKTHTNGYRHALLGLAAAAGGIRSTLEREPAELRGQLRVLYETPAVIPHPLAAHPRVPVATQDGVREAILKLAATNDGKALLKDIQMPAPAAANYAADYASLLSLQLERFVVRSAE